MTYKPFQDQICSLPHQYDDLGFESWTEHRLQVLQPCSPVFHNGNHFTDTIRATTTVSKPIKMGRVAESLSMNMWYFPNQRYSLMVLSGKQTTDYFT